MEKRRNLIIAIGFLALILMVPLLSLAKMAKNRIPIDQYTGALVGRFQMIKFNTSLTEKLSGGTYMESSEVLLGKDDWLFYKVKTDGTPIYDYMGINHFEDEELKSALAHMEESGKYLEQQGIKYAVMVIPNKEQVYSEYMPDTVVKIDEVSALDQLSAYVINENGGMTTGSYPYIDMSDMLKEKHADYPLYYKTDTHWTQMGSFLALQSMMEALYGASQSLESVTYSVEPGFVGDLTKISGTSDRFTECNYVLDGDSVDSSLYRDEVLLIVGDSFGDSMIHVAKHYYRDVKWVRISEYSEDLLNEYKPDVVLWECVERYLPDMVQYSIIGR